MTAALQHAGQEAPSPQWEAMRSWLRSPAVVSEAGEVLSWANPRHPGYSYPEAAGLWLAAECGEQAPSSLADAVACWLVAQLDARGGAGRRDLTYVFDSAVCLCGLLRYRAAGGQEPVDDAIHALHRFVCDGLEMELPVQPATAAAGHWSLSFGPHLLKTALALARYEAEFGDAPPGAALDRLLTLARSFSLDPRQPAYLHARCYALEGLAVIDGRGWARFGDAIDRGVRSLVEQQRADGSLPAFAPGLAEARSDTTAQAVRLWLLRDREEYELPIRRGLAFLAACQDSSGGLLYTPARHDVNTWATLFAAQSVEWYNDGPRLHDLL